MPAPGQHSQAASQTTGQTTGQATVGSGTEAPRSRRSSREVRSAVLRAALDEFSTRGYRATTIQDIARAAGLGISAVYNHFSSKQLLFQAAVMEPFLNFLDEFSQSWRAQHDLPWDEVRLMTALIANLYDNLCAHRKALIEVAAEDQELNASITEQMRVASTRMFQQIRAIGVEEARRPQLFQGEGVDLSIRLTVAMVTSMVVYSDVMVPTSPAPTREELIDQMARFAIWGIAREPRQSEPLQS